MQPFDPAHLPRAHRVTGDESLYDIATRYQVPLRALIDQNRLEEARKRLAAFTKAYPDESVPESIRGRLKATPDEGNGRQP